MSTTTTPAGGKVEQIKNLRETKREQAAAAKRQKNEGDTPVEVLMGNVPGLAGQHDPTPKDVQQDVEQIAQPGSIIDGAKVIDMAKKAAAPRKPRNPKNAEALEGAKKVKDALEPEPAKPAKKAATKAAPKAKAAKGTGTRVAPVAEGARVLPKPAKLTFEAKGEDGDLLMAAGARHQYRVKEGASGGWFAEQRLAKGGKWVHVAGRCDTAEQAKELAGMVEAGATWLSYQKFAGIAYAKVIEDFSKGAKK
jgi:hypothetical protein